VHWWVRHVKPKIGIFFGNVVLNAVCTTNTRDFYNAAIYDLLRADCDAREKLIALQRLKAKLIRLNGERCKTMMVDVNDHDAFGLEQPTLFYLLKA
jgi:hypothetical protein